MTDQIQSDETVPTKLLLKRKRQAEYQKAKAARKQQRDEEKSDKAEARRRQQEAKDKSLWESLQKGSEVPPPEE